MWGGLKAAASSLAIASATAENTGVTLIVSDDAQAANRIERELGFFLKGQNKNIYIFPDLETLPYDVFSPLPELISQQLLILHSLARGDQAVVIIPIATLLQRLPPIDYLEANTFLLEAGDKLDIDSFRQRLVRAGYTCVSQVSVHGEFSVRGSVLDFFPMGSDEPLRVDLLDNEVDSIRRFDPDTQRSKDKIAHVRLLPARAFPLDETGISRFRRNYRTLFEGDPQRSLIYRDVSDGHAPGGIEYYLPLFFEATATLFDYLPDDAFLVQLDGIEQAVEGFFKQVDSRYEQRRHDIERPILPPARLFLSMDEYRERAKKCSSAQIQSSEIAQRPRGYADILNFDSKILPPLSLQARAERPAGALQDFIEQADIRVLFLAESAGRREHLLSTLKDFNISPKVVDNWPGFVASNERIALAVAPLERGLYLEQARIAIITETALYGEKVLQERRRRTAKTDPDHIVRNLTELREGAPVVHEEHGIGQFIGLQKLKIGGMETEFLTLQYAKGDKLYVPVSSLHLISRYTGASSENAPLHKLGGDQWERTKKKAAEKVRDVAAELLDIHARRAAHQGYAFPAAADEYASFAATFEFEETPDQQQAIDKVLADMSADRPMDRVICGDVGFGKTEVAMRAAFQSAQSGKQVAVLAPTTLLAEQHHTNFADRFADWPIRIESLSRFRSAKQQKAIVDNLANGKVDIVIGTHKLLQPSIKFRDLGLVIIDEEHRFGVRHKEQLKALRANVDLLTLTATPIPRTLNMAMAGMRDLSIIATPPAERHPIKTFVSSWDDTLIVEACQRELQRGGQVYVLHNEVSTIENTAGKLQELMPAARIEVAHGQMRERELERIMRDFYHQRFNILVCTTIIESGIDVPSANTIIINRADKLGLAQLHQLRGRVGRSHHRAYAYMITPPTRSLTADAKKRLEAIESLEELGAGFTLATHDLEIRGAGELLGDEQSGQIHEVGFTLYMELLERAVQALKSGKQPELEKPLQHGAEIDLQIPALLPDDYIPDVHTRLVLYKRLSSAANKEDLRELQVEMIDRFGLLPPAAKNLFAVTELKLEVQPIGVKKIEAGPQGGRILFEKDPNIDPAHLIQLIQTRRLEYKLDGGDKLRFTRDMPNPETRVDQVRQVISALSPH